MIFGTVVYTYASFMHICTNNRSHKQDQSHTKNVEKSIVVRLFVVWVNGSTDLKAQSRKRRASGQGTKRAMDGDKADEMDEDKAIQWAYYYKH